MTWPSRSALAGIAAAALLAAGCGGGSEDKTKGLGAPEILSRSKAATKGLTSYQVEVKGTVSAQAAPGSLPSALATALQNPVPIDALGRVRPGRGSFDVSVPVAGIELQANVTKVDRRLYLTFAGTDYRLLVSPQAVGRVDPSKLAGGLLGWVSAPRVVGRETVHGTETVHLRGGLDGEAAFASISGLLGSAAPSPATLARARRQARAALREGTTEVWVGTKDLIPRRERIHLRARGRVDVAPQLRAAGLDLTADYTRLDAPLAVEPPANARAVRPQDLLGSLGG